MPSPAYWFIPGQSQVWPAKVADLCWRSVSGKILSSIVLSTEERWNKIGRHHSYKTYSLFMKCRNCAEECRESFAGGLLIRAELCRGDACCSATEIPSRVISGLYEGWLRNHLAFVFSSMLFNQTSVFYRYKIRKTKGGTPTVWVERRIKMVNANLLCKITDSWFVTPGWMWKEPELSWAGLI